MNDLTFSSHRFYEWQTLETWGLGREQMPPPPQKVEMVRCRLYAARVAAGRAGPARLRMVAP